ncbi:matrix [Chaco virus]|uniref:Matrix n=1 Tax=Chaco virus TaxID=1158189 RepID=A0A0D3R174_9RHAB|nr:matrix [Chaco virus]AJR28413.1 matrix [Chaco virus]
MSWLFGYGKPESFDSSVGGRKVIVDSCEIPTFSVCGSFKLILNKQLQSKTDYLELIRGIHQTHTGSYGAKSVTFLLFKLLGLTLRKDRVEENLHFYSGSFSSEVRIGISTSLPIPPISSRYSFDNKIDTLNYKGSFTGTVAYTKRDLKPVNNHKDLIKTLSNRNPLSFEDFEDYTFQFEIQKNKILISPK